MPSIRKDIIVIENDIICILSWFEKACARGEELSIKRCAKETGVRRTTVNRYIDAYKKWKSGEYKSWWMDLIGQKYGFEVKYIGKRNCKLWVSKRKIMPDILDDDGVSFDDEY